MDKNFMMRAIELAKKGRGKVEPNPLVGAVIVKNGKIISEGYHRFFGSPHAEICALRKAGNRARGSTLYINLEPCCIFGKTPPCTTAIITSGIKRVVIASRDPNPLVSGKGIKMLQRRGVDVLSGVLAHMSEKINAPFFKMHREQLPYVISKWAMTFDGKIATYTGDSKWISSIAARKYVRKIRGRVQAIVVGIKTALNDDPRLLPLGSKSFPARIVLDSNCRLPISSYLVRTANRFRTILCVSKKAPLSRIKKLRDTGCNVLVFDKMDIKEIFRKLCIMGFSNVMIEGGGELNASAFSANLVDEIMVFISPKICGGKCAITPVEGIGIPKMRDAIIVKDYTVKKFRGDIFIRGFVNVK